MDDQRNGTLAGWRGLAAIGLVAALIASPGAAGANDEPSPPPESGDPALDPVLGEERVDEIRIELERRSLPADRVAPTTRPGAAPRPVLRPDLSEIPGLEETLGVPRGRLMPEATFLVRRQGTLLKAPSGERVFVFLDAPEDRPGQTVPLRPMVMIPCATLERMERYATGDAGLEYFTVSGEVFLYRGRNYLLPTAFSTSPLEEAMGEIGARREAGRAPGTPPAEGEAVPPSPEPDPDVQDLIRDLEARRETARGLSVEAIEDEARQLGERGRAALAAELGWNEGETLLRRRGRLTRLGGGEWAFVTDSGASGTRTEAPLVLTPSLALLRLENLGALRGESQAIELSGRVLTYRTRAYVVPTMFVVHPDGELSPLQ
ncbi:MAG: hypothetical protein EA378_02605 [Phycisphaerales bacterium]|nr:MAG: hypothetical protein EA378_02605 [Phycisphaerales bacterium]